MQILEGILRNLVVSQRVCRSNVVTQKRFALAGELKADRIPGKAGQGSGLGMKRDYGCLKVLKSVCSFHRSCLLHRRQKRGNGSSSVEPSLVGKGSEAGDVREVKELRRGRTLSICKLHL